jgi:hypothetical protein
MGKREIQQKIISGYTGKGLWMDMETLSESGITGEMGQKTTRIQTVKQSASSFRLVRGRH